MISLMALVYISERINHLMKENGKMETSMDGYGIIVYPDNKMYLGQIVKGSMSGYGEFYWGDSGKRYY